MGFRYTSPGARERMHEEARREREWLYLHGVKTAGPAFTLANLGSFVKPTRAATTHE